MFVINPLSELIMSRGKLVLRYINAGKYTLRTRILRINIPVMNKQ